MTYYCACCLSEHESPDFVCTECEGGPMKCDIHPTDLVRDPNGRTGLVSEVSDKGRCIVLYVDEATAAWHASALTKIAEEAR